MKLYHIQIKDNANQLQTLEIKAESASIAKTIAMETFNVPVNNIHFCKLITKLKFEKI